MPPPSAAAWVPGYPDFLFDGNKTRVVLAQKGMPTHVSTMFVVELEDALLTGLLRQNRAAGPISQDRRLFGCQGDCASGRAFAVPPDAWSDFRTVGSKRQGFSLSFRLRDHSRARPGQSLLADGSRAVSLAVLDGGAVSLTILDVANVKFTLETDPACAARLSAPGADHALTVVADAGAHLALFVVDGTLCDGGGVQGTGWRWITAALAKTRSSGVVALGGDYQGAIVEAQAHGRALYTSEAVAQHRAWLLPDRA